jgi:hypothetical protein
MSRVFVRACAALIAFRSLTNIAKVFQGDDAILVFFGQILRGGEAALPALAVGVFMLVTGVAMWKPARWAFPLIAAYAAYVPVNLILWTVNNPRELERVGALVSSEADAAALPWYGGLAMVAYAVVAIGTTMGPAWILWKQQTIRAGNV